MKNQNGITLIALVITIIVLLILAGVGIAMLSGDNGILTRATDAKTESAKANLEEAVKLAVAENLLDEDHLGKFVSSELTEAKIKLQNENLGTVVVNAPADGAAYFTVEEKNGDTVISTVYVVTATGAVSTTAPTV